jgi:hypothetical protein
MVTSVTEALPKEPDIPEVLTAPIEVEWYTPHQKCDACPSQSYFMVVFDTGNLYFCNHHFKKNEALIFDIALDVIDEFELFSS